MLKFRLALLSGLFACLPSFPSGTSRLPTPGLGDCLGALSLENESWLRVQTGNLAHFVERRPRARAIDEISIVLPAFRELHNGNLMRLIDSINRQRENLAGVRLVVLVNNTPQVAREGGEAWRENLETVKILNDLNGGWKPANPLYLPAWVFGQRGGELVIVDGAREGRERNIGRLRNEANRVAQSHSKTHGSRHLLVQMDADTLLPRGYLKKLVALYENFPVDAVITRQRFVPSPDADAMSTRTFYKFMRLHLLNRLERAIDYSAAGAATPQITLLSSTFSDLGGMPELAMSEDYALMRNIYAHATYHYSADVEVITQDRSRPEGYDAAIRHEWNSGSQAADLSKPDSVTNPNVGLTYRPKWKIYERYMQGRMTFPDALTTYFRLLRFVDMRFGREFESWMHDSLRETLSYSLRPIGSWSPFHYAFLFERYAAKGKTTYTELLFHHILSHVSARDRSLTEPLVTERLRLLDEKNARRRMALEHFIRHLEVPTGLLAGDPLAQVDAIMGREGAKLVTELKAAGWSEFRIVEHFFFIYPDWFERRSDTPFAREYYKLELLEELILRSQNHRLGLPSIHRALEIYSGNTEPLGRPLPFEIK